MENNFGYDELGRPCKDLYFMHLCFVVATRSMDTSSKHGCIIISSDSELIATGYNGPPRGADDKNIPMTRPDKYIYMEHSERNAIYNASHEGISLKDTTFYITGFPCHDCLRGIIQTGASKIVYGPMVSVMQTEKNYLDGYELLLRKQPIILEQFKYYAELCCLYPEVKDNVREGQEQIDISKYLRKKEKIDIAKYIKKNTL